MKALFIFVLLIGSFGLKAQIRIELSDVSKHIGDSVVVKGKVFSSRAVTNGKLLLVYLGGAFPNHLLTVVLQDNVQKVLEEPLKRALEELSIVGR